MVGAPSKLLYNIRDWWLIAHSFRYVPPPFVRFGLLIEASADTTAGVHDLRHAYQPSGRLEVSSHRGRLSVGVGMFHDRSRGRQEPEVGCQASGWMAGHKRETELLDTVSTSYQESFGHFEMRSPTLSSARSAMLISTCVSGTVM